MKSVALNQLHTLSNRSILLLKTILQEEEREGLIFFREEIADLGVDQEFEIYMAITSGTIEYYNAFPVSYSQFVIARTRNNISNTWFAILTAIRVMKSNPPSLRSSTFTRIGQRIEVTGLSGITNWDKRGCFLFLRLRKGITLLQINIGSSSSHACNKKS